MNTIICKMQTFYKLFDNFYDYDFFRYVFKRNISAYHSIIKDLFKATRNQNFLLIIHAKTLLRVRKHFKSS